MTLLNIIIISIVQGLTEFLPVSSSGHLVLIPKLINLPDQGLIMDLAVHIGTLMAVLVYYRRDVWSIGMSILCWKDERRASSRKLGIYILLATIPAVIIGLVMHILIPDGIRDLRIITITTIFFGLLMGVADKYSSHDKDFSKVTLKSALIVGIAQVLAFIPGTSRSGITITAGRFLGFNRVDAARFSFLLSIPATAGAGLLGVIDVIKAGDLQMGADMLTAIVISFLAGLLAIEIMIRWLGKFGLMPFVIYRLILGAILIGSLVIVF